MKLNGNLYIIIILLASVLSCARQSSPNGGPTDEDPPAVLKSTPPNGSVNFTGKSFEITFDEFFVVNGLDQKLLISPPLEKKPEVKTRGKSMVVSFDEKLRDSVTYTFYFQDAVQDLNENNPIDNFQYVFSTGPTLDSLSVTGTIYNAFDLEPGEDIFVMLYHGSHDTLPRTTIPSYVTRATKDGKFRIDHLVGGEYSIFGLKDANNNKKYDLPDEGFAYLDSTIVLSSSTNYIPPMPDSLATAQDSLTYLKIPGEEYSLYLFTAENKRQYLKTSNRDEAYKLLFSFSMPVDSGNFSISFPDSPEAKYLIETSVKRDTFLIWLQDSMLFNMPRIPVRLVYPATDSTDKIVPYIDTIDMRFIEARPVRGVDTKKENRLKLSTNISNRKGLRPGDNIRFAFETPVIQPDTGLIKLFLVRDTIMTGQDYQVEIDTLSRRKSIIRASLMQDSTYILLTNKGAFSDIYGHQNDSMSYRFKIRNEESYGSLRINLSGYQGAAILQLLTDDEKIVDSRKIFINTGHVENFPYLEPGTYRLKLIFDIDQNGEWTTGDYDLKRNPEPVTYYPEAINIKVLWTIEQDWNISSVRDKSDALRNPVKTVATSKRTDTRPGQTGRSPSGNSSRPPVGRRD